MSKPSLNDYARIIAVIVGLVLLSSSVFAAWISGLNYYQYDFWQNSRFVIEETIKHRSRDAIVSLTVGAVALIIILLVRRDPIAFFSRLARNKRTWTIILSFALFSSAVWELSIGQHTVLNCERSKNTCVLVRTGLWWSKTQQFPFQSLKEAGVQIEYIHDDGGNVETKRVALSTDQGEILLTYVPYIYGSQEKTAKQINAFIAQPQQESLRVYEDDQMESQLSGIILILVSVIFFGVGCIL
jgi:hypothetical protein